RMGMIGGGQTSFIGAIHRSAALLDNQIELVCGCFSSNPEISQISGLSYFLPSERIYTTVPEMIQKEKSLPEGEWMDFVTIVTPNHLHFEAAMPALDNGFHVMLDKPMTYSLEEAKLLQKKIEETGLILGLTHVYSGYPAVKEARHRIKKGELGKLRKVYVEYTQGWLAERIELQSGNNAGWRTDPGRSGKAGCMGDIGTHAWHLSEYITGLKVKEVSADLTSFVEERLLDDDGSVLLRYEEGVKGVLSATQIAVGETNNIRIRIYGEKAGLEWQQEDANRLYMKHRNGITECITMGNNTAIGKPAKEATRISAGHPEGFYEAFVTIYRNFALLLQSRLNNTKPETTLMDFPDVRDGVRGMQFIETVIASAQNEQDKWQHWIE
ncbi:MAG: Gfo/Idh/MocA family oxidoreductase, partial [Tannerellaceae bacterium]|nr:Gfo/Idh/MocA family oxidoreductase [Tannerellaceae bacterium]